MHPPEFMWWNWEYVLPQLTLDHLLAIADIRERVAYIVGRLDLFETKILRIDAVDEVPKKKILVSTRDPGSANALLPVIQRLTQNPELQIDILTDGRAQEVIERNFQVTNITPSHMVLWADMAIGVPDIIVIDRSDEKGIDTYGITTFPEVPYILVEDYYSNTLIFLAEVVWRKMRLPEKICVLDGVAKEIIVSQFPQLEDRIVLTGNPWFDRFASEKAEEIQRNMRMKLWLGENDRLVSFMSAIEWIDMAKKLAETLAKQKGSFYFVFRRHPRDNISYEVYHELFQNLWVRIIETSGYTTDEISLASDIVLTSWSTEWLNGIYRGKMTAHITDWNYPIPEVFTLPLPPVRLWGSVEVNNIDQLDSIIPELLDPNSELAFSVRESIRKNYPTDGNNTGRVVDIIRNYLW